MFAHIGGLPIEEGLLSLAPVAALGLGVVLRAAVAERVLRVRRRVAARRTG